MPGSRRPPGQIPAVEEIDPIAHDLVLLASLALTAHGPERKAL